MNIKQITENLNSILEDLDSSKYKYQKGDIVTNVDFYGEPTNKKLEILQCKPGLAGHGDTNPDPLYVVKNLENGNKFTIEQRKLVKVDEDCASLIAKVDNTDAELKELIKKLKSTNEDLVTPIEIGLRVGTKDGTVTGTVKEVDVANNTVKITVDNTNEEKEFKNSDLDIIVKQ